MTSSLASARPGSPDFQAFPPQSPSSPHRGRHVLNGGPDSFRPSSPQRFFPWFTFILNVPLFVWIILLFCEEFFQKKKREEKKYHYFIFFFRTVLVSILSPIWNHVYVWRNPSGVEYRPRSPSSARTKNAGDYISSPFSLSFFLHSTFQNIVFRKYFHRFFFFVCYTFLYSCNLAPIFIQRTWSRWKVSYTNLDFWFSSTDFVCSTSRFNVYKCTRDKFTYEWSRS